MTCCREDGSKPSRYKQRLCSRATPYQALGIQVSWICFRLLSCRLRIPAQPCYLSCLVIEHEVSHRSMRSLLVSSQSQLLLTETLARHNLYHCHISEKSNNLRQVRAQIRHSRGYQSRNNRVPWRTPKGPQNRTLSYSDFKVRKERQPPPALVLDLESLEQADILEL